MAYKNTWHTDIKYSSIDEDMRTILTKDYHNRAIDRKAEELARSLDSIRNLSIDIGLSLDYRLEVFRLHNLLTSIFEEAPAVMLTSENEKVRAFAKKLEEE